MSNNSNPACQGRTDKTEQVAEICNAVPHALDRVAVVRRELALFGQEPTRQNAIRLHNTLQDLRTWICIAMGSVERHIEGEQAKEDGNDVSG